MNDPNWESILRLLKQPNLKGNNTRKDFVNRSVDELLSKYSPQEKFYVIIAKALKLVGTDDAGALALMEYARRDVE